MQNTFDDIQNKSSLFEFWHYFCITFLGVQRT